MNIVNGNGWTVTARECGSEFGGDHHIYIEVLGLDGKRPTAIPAILRDGKPLQYERKPENEPLLNIPLFMGDNISVQLGDAEVSGLTASFGKTELGDWHHHSFYVVFRKNGSAPPPIVQPPVHDDRLDRLASLITRFCSDALEIIGQ